MFYLNMVKYLIKWRAVAPAPPPATDLNYFYPDSLYVKYFEINI